MTDKNPTPAPNAPKVETPEVPATEAAPTDEAAARAAVLKASNDAIAAEAGTRNNVAEPNAK